MKTVLPIRAGKGKSKIFFVFFCIIAPYLEQSLHEKTEIAIKSAK